MSKPTAPHRLCAVEGCRGWALRDQDYCYHHYRQWQQNLELGVPDPTPRLVGGKGPFCQARRCKRVAVPNSDYCAAHTAQLREGAESDGVAEAFAALLARLDAHVARRDRVPEAALVHEAALAPDEAAPDCLDILRRELDLLEAARKVLAEHATASSRTGWKLMSPMAFMRLWLSSAETVTSIVKARFVIETATTADFDRLLSGVYARIERQGPPLDQHPLTAQPLLPGLAEEVVEGDFSPSEGEFADRRRPTADSQEPTANSQ